jgi:hypothetical protein
VRTLPVDASGAIVLNFYGWRCVGQTAAAGRVNYEASRRRKPLGGGGGKQKDFVDFEDYEDLD